MDPAESGAPLRGRLHGPLLVQIQRLGPQAAIFPDLLQLVEPICMPPEGCHQQHAAAILDNLVNHHVNQCPLWVGIDDSVRSPPDIKRIVNIRAIVPGVRSVVLGQLVVRLAGKQVHLRVNAEIMAHSLEDGWEQHHVRRMGAAAAGPISELLWNFCGR